MSTTQTATPLAALVVPPAHVTVTPATRYNPHSYPTSFLGVEMTQAWNDLLVWERFFNERPQVRAVCELGTGMGGLSVFLALQCAQRGMQFMTVDHQRWLDTSSGVPALLQMERGYLVANLFGAGGDAVRAMIARDDVHPLVLWCDDGNKPWEVREFGTLLRAGDFVAVHDWGVEIHEEDMRVIAAREILVGSMSRWFEVLGGTP